MNRIGHVMGILLIALGLSACATSGGGSVPTVGQMVPFGQYGDPADYPFMVVAWRKSLGTDHIIKNSPPQEYGQKLVDAVDNPSSGVQFYSGPPLRFRLVEVSGVTPGTQAKLLKSGRFVGMAPFQAGTIFEIDGTKPAIAVFIIPRKAWSGKDPIVCYELIGGQGYHLTDLPHKVGGKYKGRENLDCSPPGDIARILATPRFNRVRMHAVTNKN